MTGSRTEERALFFIFWQLIIWWGLLSMVAPFPPPPLLIVQVFLPLCHNMMISQISGWLGFPIWAHCVVRAIHLFHMPSVVRCVEQNLPWTSHPACQSRCQKAMSFSVSHFWSNSNPFVTCQDPFFSWDVTGLRSSLSLNPESRLSSSLHGYFLSETPGKTMLPSCNVEHIFHILPCHDCPKGCCMNNLLFNLSKTCCRSGSHLKLLFSRVTWQRGLQSWLSYGICILQKLTVPKKTCVSFLLTGHAVLDNHIHWTLTTSILPFYT